MKNYRIRANAIDSTYKANSEKEALEKYAKDAGYKSYADLVEQHGEIDSIEEVKDSELMKSTRKALGLTQSQMAERCGYGSGTRISEIENGKENLSGPARKLIEEIAKNNGIRLV